MAYDYKYYSGDSHGSVPLITTYDALHFIFKFYDLRFTVEDYTNFSRKTITKLEDHYKQVSRHFGFAFPVPEMMMNQLGYLAISQKKMEEAEYLFRNMFPICAKLYINLVRKRRASSSWLTLNSPGRSSGKLTMAAN